jgi:hypothetical protein
MYGSLSNPFRSMASSWGIMSCDRLMRCGHDELRLSSPIRVNGKIKCHDPVEHYDFWWFER